jgi:hypothetical protein
MPDPNAVSNVLSTQVAAAAATVWIMQTLKSAQWFPLLQHGQKVASRITSMIAACFITVGIGYTWNRNTDGSHVLILAIPTTMVLVIGIWHAFQQFCYHELIYQSTVNKLSVTTSAQGETTAPARVTAEGQVVIPKPNGGSK